MTRWPAAASAGTWRSHMRWSRPRPWIRTTGGPAPVAIHAVRAMAAQQERQRDRVEFVRLFELRRVPGVFDHRERAVGEERAHLCAMFRGARPIMAPLYDHRRHRDTAEIVERARIGVRARRLDRSRLRSL